MLGIKKHNDPLEDILARCRKNDRMAQKQLFDIFAKPMLQVCYNYVQDYHAANDMLQDGFIKVFYNLDKFDGRGAFRSWIKTIMINTCLNYLKSEKRYTKTSIEEAIHIGDNKTEAMHKMELEQIKKAIDNLPEGYKKMLVLYAVEGFSYHEIADIMNISEVSVRTQVFRARKALVSKIPEFNYI